VSPEIWIMKVFPRIPRSMQNGQVPECRLAQRKRLGTFRAPTVSFAAGVSLASVKTEEQKLWLVVGLRLVGKTLRWTIEKASNLPWTYV